MGGDGGRLRHLSPIEASVLMFLVLVMALIPGFGVIFLFRSKYRSSQFNGYVMGGDGGRLRHLSPVEASVLMFLVLIMAVIPGFGVIFLFRSLILPMNIVEMTILSVLMVTGKNIFAFLLGLFALVCYADIAFPAVMRAFAFIMVRTDVDDACRVCPVVVKHCEEKETGRESTS